MNKYPQDTTDVHTLTVEADALALMLCASLFKTRNQDALAVADAHTLIAAADVEADVPTADVDQDVHTADVPTADVDQEDPDNLMLFVKLLLTLNSSANSANS
jgi:hypothetical protein